MHQSTHEYANSTKRQAKGETNYHPNKTKALKTWEQASLQAIYDESTASRPKLVSNKLDDTVPSELTQFLRQSRIF